MRYVVLACVVVVGGCGAHEGVAPVDGDADAGPDGSPDATPDASPDASVAVTCSGATVSLANDITPILVHGCGGGEICHGGFGGTPNEIRAQLVGVAALRDSYSCDAGVLVVPGDLGDSYLLKKLTGVGMCPNTLRMPPGTSLAAGDLQKIADWICGGALDN